MTVEHLPETQDGLIPRSANLRLLKESIEQTLPEALLVLFKKW